MTLGLFGPGPLQMLFSVLMMQGLSLTMFRTFLNQAIPRFDPMRFSFKLGNDPQLSSTTPTSAPNIDQQNLMPIINMLAPILLQQHLQRSQNNQMQINDKSSLTQTQVMSPIGSYQMPVQSVPIQSSMTNMPPMPQQVIIIPQMQSPSRGSASTHIPVLMNAPNNNVNKDKDHPVRITKRILERPPKTTRKPNRVINRAHAGAIHLSFITPKPPISARKYVIPVVTANSLVGDSDIESIKTFNKSNSLELNNASINENLVDNDNDTKISINFQQTTTSRPTISTSDPITSTVTDTTTTTTTTQAITLSQTTTLTETFDKNDIEISDNNKTFDGITNATEISETEKTSFDKNLLNHKLDSKDNISLNSTSDLVHKDFVDHIKNISENNQIDSNLSQESQQNQDIYFENTKDERLYKPKRSTFKRVCYYLLKVKNGDLKIEDIDPFICSHIIIGYATVNQNNIMVPKNITEDLEKYRGLADLKTINRNQKIIISIEDDKESQYLSRMVSNEKSRDIFVASVLDMCDMFGFDGVDIHLDTQFITATQDNKYNYIFLLKELKAESVRRFRDDFIISTTIGTQLVIGMAANDIPVLAEVVDFVNLMSYDFNEYRNDRPYTAHHSQLYPRPIEKGYYLTLNAAWATTYWANKGMPLNKIILGLPTYGRSYNLAVPVSYGMDAPVYGPGMGSGQLNYTAVCHFLATGATHEFDVYSQVPFAYKNFDWVAYESDVSAALKAQWVVKAGMGGIMTFALNFDDTQGFCQKDGKKFPIQRAVSHLLQMSSLISYQQTSHSPDITNTLTKQ